MKLFTNKGNFQCLKIQVSAQLSNTEINVVETKPDEKIVAYLSNSRLPILEVYPEKYIFSPNAASRLLLKKKLSDVDEAQIDQWLEWESAQLNPVLVPYLITAFTPSKKENSYIEDIKVQLQEVDSALKDKQFLVGDGLTVADISVWSALYLVLSGKHPLKGWETQFVNLKSWFQKLSDQQAFQHAVSTVFAGGESTIKASLYAQPVPLSREGSLKDFMSGAPGKDSKVAATATETQNEVSPTVTVTAEEIDSSVTAWNSGLKQCPKPLSREHPILPKPGCRNYLITSALPYVNNVPHLGNIIGCVLSADVFSRYCRLRNYNSVYVCGTDEYGTATETKAIEEGLTPQQICDKYTELHRQIYEWFNIDFDYFGRTSTEQQTEIAQDIFWKLYKRDYILKDTVDQLKCEKCDRFLADRFVEGICPFCAYIDARGDQCDACGKLINATELKEPKCKMCHNTPVIKTSNHLFLDLPKIEPLLNDHLNKVFNTGTWTSNARTITTSWIRDGLKPRCISRDLKWGTQVPLEGYTNKVFYVWFDAPIGYLSITANYTKEWEKWWKNPSQVSLYNFLGKDNVPFHSVIFPCTLLGSNDKYTVVNNLIATEYLNYEDGKFSKSRGVGVFGNQAKETGIPADIFRFYLLFVRPESQDSSFSWDDFQLKNNSELLNNLGNFINRALSFLSKSFAATIQKITLNDDDKQLLVLVNRELHLFIKNMEQVKIRDSISNILSISRCGNQYMQSNKPWVLVKGSESEKARAGSVISLAANVSCLLSILLQPYMPNTSKIIQQQLNAPGDCNIIYKDFVCHLPKGHQIGTPSPLFQKIEAATISELRKKFSGSESK